jgi:hypothetical protein
MDEGMNLLPYSLAIRPYADNQPSSLDEKATQCLYDIIKESTQSAGGTAKILFFFCPATDVRTNHDHGHSLGLDLFIVEKQHSLFSHVRKRYDQVRKALFEAINALNMLLKRFREITCHE